MDAGTIAHGIVAACAFVALGLSIWQEVDRRRTRQPRLAVWLTGDRQIPNGFDLTRAAGLPVGGWQLPMAEAKPLTRRFGVPWLFLAAENTGDVPAILTMWGLLLPRGRELWIPWDDEVSTSGTIQLPATLNPGESGWREIEQGAVLRQLAEMGYGGRIHARGVWRDHKGKHYRSAPVVLDLDRPENEASPAPAPWWRFWGRRR
jgi:hypothetical protein